MKYRVIQQYVMQDEWVFDAEDEEKAIELAMTSDPEIESRIKSDWIEVEEVKDENN
jgi:CRISPR/Cas system-associated protein Cas5 (RAMP superfamily)